MANNSAIVVKIKTKVQGQSSVSELSMDLGELQKAARAAQESVSRMRMSEMVNTCASLGFAVGDLVRGFGTAADKFKSFDSSMRTVNTMAAKGEADFDALKDKVTSLAKEVPVARDVLANGQCESSVVKKRKKRGSANLGESGQAGLA